MNHREREGKRESSKKNPERVRRISTLNKMLEASSMEMHEVWAKGEKWREHSHLTQILDSILGSAMLVMEGKREGGKGVEGQTPFLR